MARPKQAAWLLLAALMDMLTGIQSLDVQEVCENDLFHAQCGENEVVFITHARYGRMRFGGCITGQHGKLDCVIDARPYLDAKCSGRQKCDVTVATLIPEQMQPCSKDLRSYLEVVYECVKVVNASRSYCQNSEAVEVSEQSGYLSSLVNMQTGCGSFDSPWWVTVQPGQNITLTLLDFGTVSQSRKDHSVSSMRGSGPVCHVYAVIKEQGATTTQPTETVCAGTQRERKVLTSSTNRLEVRLVTRNEKSERKDLYFLFRFEANGCPDIPKPPKGSVRRTGNEASIRCYDDDEVYTVHCEGNKWTGNYRNCSSASPVQGAINQGRWSFLHQKHGVSVLIILCIAVTVGLCILAVGLVHIKRKRRGHEVREEYKRRLPEATTYGPNTAPDKPILPPSRTYNKTGDSTEFYHSSENDYYRTWQMQRHAPQPMAPLPAVPSSGMHVPPPQFTTQTSTCSTHSGGYQRSTTQAANEHIYESPKFDRKDYSSDDYELDGINAEYFELDPETNK